MSHPLCVAFVWHMHQPYYRDLVTGECSMPWVRLHAAKDYLDMLARLEPFPTLHQTFNIVPSLLDQLEEYLPPANRTDRFLELSRKSAGHLTAQEQRFILQWFFLANLERMIKPYPRYHDLLAKRGTHVGEADWPKIQKRFHPQDHLDLQVWFNLAWIDPWLRRHDPKLAALEAKGHHFTEEEKHYVLDQHTALIAKVIPAYRAAAERGQIELTSSPYYHPIMPLLCDIRSAHVALPHLPLPPTMTFRHPEDARWHLQQGLARHQAAFGTLPNGLWPPEGSVSEDMVALALESNIRWIATDEDILWRTLKVARSPSLLYKPHRLRRNNGDLAIVFRDRELSDLIGFVYSHWDPTVAVADFLKRLEDIHRQCAAAARPALVSIILDGENAWESYPNDGHEFLTALYEALASREQFRCVTVNEFLQQHPLDHEESLPTLFSGSWIDGNFATWIGHAEKNAAWEHLARAREALSSQSREDPASRRAWQSLGVAEGSDWMWWFGDTHFTAQAEEFDRLFRTHLANSYRLAGLPVPQTLNVPIRRQAAHVRCDPTGLIHPTIDGRESSYYEWLYAGKVELRQQYSAIQRGHQCLQTISYGFDDTHQYLRLDVDLARLAQLSSWTIELVLASGTVIDISPDPAGARASLRTDPSTLLPCALARLIELAIPHSLLGLKAEEKLRLALSLREGADVLERYPTEGTFELLASASHLDPHAWLV